jgi:phage portal protein BeeE
MRLLDRLADRYSLRQGFWEGMASGAAVYMGTYGDPGKEKTLVNLVGAARDAYQSNGAVFAVILIRLALFSEARFVFQSLVDKHTYGTPDLRILEEPWPNCTTGELLARMEQDLSLAGNCYLWKAADDRLVRLPPDEVTIISQQIRVPGGHYREIVGYDWDPTPVQNVAPGTDNRSEQAQTFTVDEIAHWSPYPDPRANFRGMSWLTPVLRDIGADTAMTSYKIAYLENMAAPNLLIKYQQKLRPDTLDSIGERMHAKFGGSNAFRTFVLDQGADATVLDNSLDRMGFASTQEAGANRICSASGVDPILIGLLTLGRAAVTYEQAMRRLGDITMRPLWRSACAALQKLVPNVPPAGVRLWFDTADIAALRASETERAQTMQVNAAALLTLVQAGYTRESSVAALQTGDVSQLQEAPSAPPPGISGRETATERYNAPAAASGKVTDGNPSGEPPAPSQKPGPPTGNGKGPTPKQMRPMPPALLRRP